MDRTRHRPAAARIALAAALFCLGPAPAAAAPSVTVIAEQPLRFGTLIVPGSGWRTIGADGTVADSGLLAIGGGAAGPARFTITYDRGSDSTRPINIVMQVFVTGTQSIRRDQVTGRLSRFETDLPGIAGLLSSPAATFTINGCRQRRCSQTFRVGARLQVDRANGGAELVFPLPVTASVLAVF